MLTNSSNRRVDVADPPLEDLKANINSLYTLFKLKFMSHLQATVQPPEDSVDESQLLLSFVSTEQQAMPSGINAIAEVVRIYRSNRQIEDEDSFIDEESVDKVSSQFKAIPLRSEIKSDVDERQRRMTGTFNAEGGNAVRHFSIMEVRQRENSGSSERSLETFKGEEEVPAPLYLEDSEPLNLPQVHVPL